MIKRTMQDKIFDIFAKKTNDQDLTNDELDISNFMSSLTEHGILKDDPRTKEMYQNIYSYQREQLYNNNSSNPLEFNRKTFKRIIDPNIDIIKKVFSKNLVIPDFKEFCGDLKNLFDECHKINEGFFSNYLPQFQRFKESNWAMSICTIDGQRFNLGDYNTSFTFQSIANPFTYALALNNYGVDFVHKYIGKEPSGEENCSMTLDKDKRPHNPIINTGAILTTALLKPEQQIGDRFDMIHDNLKRAAGISPNNKDAIGFNNSCFLTERSKSDRNYALAYLMKENKCYPESTASKFKESLELYFQVGSLETTTEICAQMAATLANGGINPLTCEQVYNNEIIKHVLSLLLSCGCYDYSGHFAFEIGVPAKSAVSGCVLLVIPNVAGICLWSPLLNKYGCSTRGVAFAKKLTDIYNFHNFDCINENNKYRKKDPRVCAKEIQGLKIMNLLFAAQAGDLSALIRYHIMEVDMNLCDYDGRTALHIAAAEGHVGCVEYLLKACKCSPYLMDRWGKTALDEAKYFQRMDIETLLNTYMNKTKYKNLHRRDSEILNLFKQKEDMIQRRFTIHNTDCPDLTRYRLQVEASPRNSKT